jgi:hypothetical protein
MSPVPARFSLCHCVTRGTSAVGEDWFAFIRFLSNRRYFSRFHSAGTRMALKVGAARVAATNEFHLWQKF